MQNAALAAVGLSTWRYQRLPVPPEMLVSTLRALEAAGFRGANVTIPHKEAALELADGASPAAREIGAANTLLFEGGQIRAENTDAPGLLDALPIDPQGMTAMVLGAGGSARAAVWALRGAGAAEVRVWNRSPERARVLAAALGAVAVPEPAPADLLVNCTPAGMGGNTLGVKWNRAMADEVMMYRCVVDFAYGRADTPLIAAARGAGLPAIDGLDLLVAQGALSFESFTGKRAPIEVMREAVRAR